MVVRGVGVGFMTPPASMVCLVSRAVVSCFMSSLFLFLLVVSLYPSSES